MRFHHLAGIGILLMSLGVAWGGGTVPKREEVPKYIKMLSAPNAKDRAKAAERLGARGQVNFKDVENAIDPLKQVLQKDKDAGTRKAAAVALGSIHPEPEGVVPILIKTVEKDNVTDVRVAAAEALGVFGPDAAAGAPAIRELMTKFTDKKDRNIRKSLADALGKVTGKPKKK
jgi:HEAT repeat protein